MSGLSLHLLGSIAASLNDQPLLKFRTNRVQALLIYLVTESASGTSFLRRESLVDLLWPRLPQKSAQSNLRQTLYYLRKAVPEIPAARDGKAIPFLLTDRQTVQINPTYPVKLDVADFITCLNCGQDQWPQAVDLYRGDFLSDFYLPDTETFEVWAGARRAAFQRQVLDTLDSLTTTKTELGLLDEAETYARRQLEIDDLRESAYRQLMRVLARNGQRSEALALYEQCRLILQTELGVDPSLSTQALWETIRTGELEATGQGTGRLRGVELQNHGNTSKPERRTNLPPQPTPFVGREALLAEIGARLEEPACRLLTLVGPGGSGKTRLALEAAARLKADAYEHGVFFVALAPLDDAEAIVPTVAQALGFSFHSGAGAAEPRRQLLNRLRTKNLLLLMDNFEHLLDEGGTQLVTDILQIAPRIKVLATSRANLNLREEHRFPIGGMDFPARDTLADVAGYSAPKLFVQSARRARPDFELTTENAGDVVRICHLVEGMPLGLLLAAPWVEVLTPAEIVHEVTRGLDFLETDMHGVPERQRSMRAVFDHSWNLLTQRERAVMETLSVFRGGFSRKAVQAVTGATLRQLKGLVDKSLLQRAANGRYQVHELLRQFADDRLDESPSTKEVTRDRHCAYYAGFLERRAADLKGPRQRTALAEIEADSENARAAWDWAVERGQVEWLDQAAEGLFLFYQRRGRYEQGVRACHRAAERLAGKRSAYAVRAHARVLTWLAAFDEQLGHNESAQKTLVQSLSLLDSFELSDQDTRSERGFALRQQGNVTLWLGEYERARGLFERSLALYRELGDRWGTAIALVGLGWSAWNLGGYAEAEGWHREGLALRRVLGDQRGLAESLHALSGALGHQGQFEERGRLAREVIAISRETGDRVNLAQGLQALGGALSEVGKFPEAHAQLEESAAIWEELESCAREALAINLLGVVQMHLGRYQDARVRFQLSLRLARESGYNLAIRDSLCNLGRVALAEGAFSKAQRWFREFFAAAQASSGGLRGQMDEALYGLYLGFVERGQGNKCQARELFTAEPKIAVELRPDWWCHYWVGAIALLLADEGETERAVDLYSLASRYPEIANSQWFEDVAGKHIAAVADTLPPEAVAAAQERGRARELAATVEELLEELGE